MTAPAPTTKPAYREIRKEQIYDEVLQLIEDAKSSGGGYFYYYSISSCFGFYTRGMRTFSDVVTNLQQLAAHKEVEMRLLIEFADQPIDHFAMDVLRTALGPDVFSQRVRELREDISAPAVRKHGGGKHGIYPHCMFYLLNAEKKKLLVTREMQTTRDRALQLDINQLQDGKLYEGEEAMRLVGPFIEFFNDVWTQSPTPRPSLSRLPTDWGDMNLSQVLRAVFTLKLRVIQIIWAVAASLFLLGYWSRPLLEKLFK